MDPGGWSPSLVIGPESIKIHRYVDIIDTNRELAGGGVTLRKGEYMGHFFFKILD